MGSGSTVGGQRFPYHVIKSRAFDPHNAQKDIETLGQHPSVQICADISSGTLKAQSLWANHTPLAIDENGTFSDMEFLYNRFPIKSDDDGVGKRLDATNTPELYEYYTG